jgi:DNA-directed RNA polymerase specialized sigma24 family protein
MVMPPPPTPERWKQITQLTSRVKRGRDNPHVSLDDAEPASVSIDPVDVFVLDRALSRLEALDPQQGRIVELRFFGGLTIQETAEVMRISSGTVKRDWTVARPGSIAS